MKKLFALALSLAMLASLVACSGGGSSQAPASTGGGASAAEGGSTGGDGDGVVLGVVWYNYADTFIATARSALESMAQGSNVTINATDSQNDAGNQTNNIANLYRQGVDIIAVNNINTNAKGELIEEAKAQGVPILFINTDSPSDEEFELYEDAYHISSAAEQSGVIMGEQIVEYWQNNPDADRNGNGQLDYVMLLGLQSHYDTRVRAQFSVETVEEAGISVNLVQEAICNYQRSEAQDAVASILQARRDDVDVIFACNDDMALGAIEALKASGFFGDSGDYVAVVGVDATAVGVEAILEGTFLGTALNNPVTLAESIFSVAQLIGAGEEITQANVNVDGTRVEGRHVYIDYVSITADNTEDAAY